MHSLDATEILTSTVLVNNIHCASCVSYIQELLAPQRYAIKDIEVNVMTGEVRIVHENTISTRQICAIIGDGAFEVYSATVKRVSGSEEVNASIKGKERANEETHQIDPTRPTESQVGCLQYPKRQQHAEKCDACKKELEAYTDEPVQKVERNYGSGDIEKMGEMRAVASSQRPLRTEETLVEPVRQQPDGNVEKDKTASGQKNKATLSIGGMTCASCTSAIDRGLRDLPCVEDIEVTLMTNSASVTYRGTENIGQITQTIDDLGYDCVLESTEVLQPSKPTADEGKPTERAVTLQIQGMFCKHCPPRIVDALRETYGSSVMIVQSPTMTDPTLKITYIPDTPHFTIRDIVTTIDNVDQAFTTSLHHLPSVEERSQTMQRRESHRLLLRVLFSFIIAVPTFLIGIVWMSLVPSSNWIRHSLDQSTWSGSASRRDWALFILATLVMFLATDVFHKRALKEIRSLWRRSSRVPILRRFYRFGSMNLLVSAGTSVAYFSSVAILAIDASTKNPQGMGHSQNYFDSVVFLTFFILIGRWLEIYSKARTGNAVAMLTKLKPSEAVLITNTPHRTEEPPSGEVLAIETKSSTSTTTIGAELLEVGDFILVRQGASPPADGVIVAGTTRFNESSLTGEARPASKVEGDKAFAGTINLGDAVKVKVTETGGASMIDQIVSVVRQGQTKRAPVEHVVDVVTAYFVPVITALAILTWLIWLALGQSGRLDRKYLSSSQGGWAFWSLEFAIAVFVVACPCGIGLAAPTALFVGSGLAAKHGILVQGGGEAFEEASRVDAVVFDKTGTLTEGGDLKITDHEVLVKDEEAEAAWAMIMALEESSTHPLARAIHDFASSQDSASSLATLSVSEEVGKGLRGTFSTADSTYEAALGSEAFIETLVEGFSSDYFTINTLSRWKSQAKSVAVFALRSSPSTPTSAWRTAALFAITDPVRASTIPTLQALQKRKIPTYMLTGDNPVTASAVASTLGIPLDHVFAGLLPNEKAEKINWLQQTLPSQQRPSILSRVVHRFSSKNTVAAKATIAFVGDGTNDALALTAADVSIALAHPSASDIALTSASFIILSTGKRSLDWGSQTPPESSTTGTDHLSSLLTLLDLSSRVFKRVKFNFGWAVIYNAVLVPVAAGILFKVREEGWRLGPIWGSAAMAASSVSVVLSSLALRWESWEQVRFWR